MQVASVQPLTFDNALHLIRANLFAIRDHEASIIKLALDIGATLHDLAEQSTHGTWMAIEADLAHECGEAGFDVTPRSLRRYRLLWEQVGAYYDLLSAEQVQVGLGVLYALSSKHVSDDVRATAMDEIAETGTLTTERAQELIAASEAVESVPENVRDAVHAVVIETGVTNPSVIEGLGILAVTQPALFDEIRQTGVMDDWEGNQLPVKEASRTDIKNILNMADEIERGEQFERMKTVFGRPRHIFDLLAHVLTDNQAEYRIVVYRRIP